MAGTTRAYDRNDVAASPAEGTPVEPPRRFVLTRARAALIIVSSYLAAVSIAAAVFYGLGSKDERAWQVTLAFAVLVAVLCLRSLVIVLRRPRIRPDVA